ncbi:uncharacterized protein [Haliotis cracherodii]|uniref:uncharacterized protein n=1 Tax=Haliotis cracherodii TaxID=6455 RepID=UPI0039E8BFA5
MMLRICIAVFYLCTVCNGTPVDKTSYLWQAHNGGGYDTLSNQVINLPSGPNLGYEANSNSQVNMILNLADNTDNVVNSEGMTNAGNSYNVLSLLGGGNQDGEVQSLDTVVSSGQTQLTDIRTTQTAQIVLTTRLETSSNKEYRTESTKVPDMSPQNTTTKLTEAGKAELLPSTTFNVTASTTSLPRGRFGSASLSRVNATSLNNTTKADTPHAMVRLLPNTTTSGKLISDSGIVSTHVPSDTTISSAKGSATATPKTTAGESPIFKAASKPWSGQTNTTAAKQKHTSTTIVTTKSSSIWRTPTLSPITQNTSTKYTITTAITPITVHTSSIITTTHTTTATPYITTHLVNSFTNILLTSSPPPTMFDKHIINNNHPRTFDTTSTASPLNTTIQSRSFVTTYSPTNPVATEASLNTNLSGSTFSKTTQSKTITSSTTSTSTTTTLSPATIHSTNITYTPETTRMSTLINTASETVFKPFSSNTTLRTATISASATTISESKKILPRTPSIITTQTPITTASSPTTIPKTQTPNTTPFSAKFTPSATIIPQSTTHLLTIISTITTASSPTTIPKTQTPNTTPFTATFTPSTTIIPQSTTHLPTIISTITTASSPTTIPKTQTTNTTPFTATFTPSTTIIPQSTTHLPTIISTITTASSPTTIPKTQTPNTTPFTATFTPSTTIIPQSTTHLPTIISTITTASSPTTIPKTQTTNTTPFTATFTPSTTIIPQSTTHLPTIISTITTASSPTTIPKTQTPNTTPFTATFTPFTTIIPQSTTYLPTIISTITTASSPTTIPKTQTSNTTPFTATFTPSTTIIPQSITHLPTIISTITTASSPTTTPFTTSTSLPATAIPKTHSITSATPFTVTPSNTIRSPPKTTITSSTTTISPSTTKLPSTPSATRETPFKLTITSSTITYSTTLSTTTYNPITTVHSTVALSTSRSTPSLSTTLSTTVTARPTPLVRTSPKMPMKSKPQAPSNTPTKMDTTTDDLISTTSHDTIEEKLLNISERCTNASGTSFPFENNCRAYWQCENEKPVMKCCPNKATFTWNHGCIPNPSCNPECDPGYDISSMCDDRLKVDGNFHYYYRMVHKLAIIRPCPDGTIFREELCRCDYPPTGFQDHPACHPKFEMTFDGDSPFEDISSSGNDFEMFHIQPTAYGTGQFYDKSMMIIKRLNGTTMGYKFAVHLKFFAREGSDRMVLLSDCLHGNDVESASVDIRLHTSDGTVVFRVHTYSSPLWHVQIPYKRNEWNMVSLIYEGTKVKASVNKSQKTNPVFFGSLRRKQAGLVIGKCSDSDGFTGEIDSMNLSHSKLY